MKFILPTILMLVLLVSCNTDENLTSSNEKLTINLALDKVKLESINSEEPIEFDISSDGDNGILLGVAQIIPPYRFKKDFANRFGNTDISFKDLLNRNENNRARVCCTVNGQNIGCIDCNDSDGTCLGEVVQACINDGGCSTTCPQRIRYIPSLKTFYITKLSD